MQPQPNPPTNQPHIVPVMRSDENGNTEFHSVLYERVAMIDYPCVYCPSSFVASTTVPDGGLEAHHFAKFARILPKFACND